MGEADEAVKATVTGQLGRTYQVRYLVDALRKFAGRRINVDIKAGPRSTVMTAAEPDPDGLVLHYVVMPMLPA